MNNTDNLPAVGIIVLNWNNYTETAACLTALEDISYPESTIYLVDNGSTDDSARKLEEEFEQPKFMFNGDNLGFAAGNNKGIRAALEDGMDHVLLVNNDVIPRKGFLQKMVQTIEGIPNTAIVGCEIRESETDEVWFSGSRFYPSLVKTNHVLRQRSGEFETDHVTGALMLISSEFLEEHGALDEDYFFGIEDLELSWRARKNGWRVMVNANAVVEHKVGATAGRRSPFKHYHATRNRLHFSATELSYRQRAVFYPFFVISRCWRFVEWFGSGKTELVKAVLLGAFDYFRGSRFREISAFE